MIEAQDPIRPEFLENVRISETEDGFSIALVDNAGFEIVRGFGSTLTEAINDMHSNLI